MQSAVSLSWDQSDGEGSPETVVSVNCADGDWRYYSSIAGCARPIGAIHGVEVSAKTTDYDGIHIETIKIKRLRWPKIS
jgi:hypothetical protein